MKKERIILSAILLIGLAVRIFIFNNEVYVGIDGVSYMRLGKNLIENGRYAFGENYNWGVFFQPMYPILIGMTDLLFNDLFFSAKFVSLFFSGITIFLFYLIGKELHNEESGLFASFIYAFHPSMLEVSVRVATEALFFFLLFLCIYLYMTSIRKNKFYSYMLLGILTAFLYLTRPEGIYLLLLPFLSLVGSNPFKNKKRLLGVAVAIVFFFLISSPYLFYIKNSTGKFALSGKAVYLPVILDAGVKSEEVEYDKAAYSLNDRKTHLQAFDVTSKASIISVIAKKPAEFVRGYISNSKIALKTVLRFLMSVLMPLLFAFFSKDLFKDRNKMVLLVFSFVFFAVYPSFFILEKLMFPTALFLVLIASLGFVRSTAAISAAAAYYCIRDNRVVLCLEKNIKCIIIMLCILTLCFFNAFRTDIFGEKEFPVEHMKAGLFLKNRVSSEYEKLNVMHRTPWVSFYSDARYTMLPYANSSDVVNFAKRYHVDFIVIDERSSVSEWEMYNELINMDKYSDEVDLVYEDDSEKLIRMFKVKY
ncbi:MAG: glycosyltransferase family 39 protein [Thermodesulfovibrionia bacterium]|nr:glycosyltransferase family 39 protein [Thermodesulfovibrionia bacterium]